MFLCCVAGSICSVGEEVGGSNCGVQKHEPCSLSFCSIIMFVLLISLFSAMHSSFKAVLLIYLLELFCLSESKLLIRYCGPCESK